MEFDKDRVFTAVNADELHAGDKVIVADTIHCLYNEVAKNNPLILEVTGCNDWTFERRIITNDGFSSALAYLVERAENCTNCGNRGNSYCSCFIRGKSDDELSRTVCGNYIRLSEPKTEKKCEDCKKAYTDYPCVANVYHDATGQACKKFEAESHYRSFKDIDELIKVWDAKIGTPNWGTDGDLTMPHIWIREKGCNKSADLITCYGSKGITVRGGGIYFDTLFAMFEFLDGSPCGVEE